MTEKRMQESNYVISQVIKDHIKEDLINPIVNSNRMAKDEYLREILSVENEQSEALIMSYLRGIKNGYGSDSCFVVSDKTKKYFTAEGFEKVISPATDEIDVWYTNFLAKNNDYALTVEKEAHNSDKLNIFFDNRITDKSGKFLGVAVVAIHLEQLQNTIKDLENRFDVHISLVDRKGLVI